MKKLNIVRHSKKEGFTLIELLVVIAIIGILSSVVLVSLNSARQKGTNTRLQEETSNMRTTLESGFTSSYPDLITSGTAGVDTYTASNWASSSPLGLLRTDIVNSSGGHLQVYDAGCTSGATCSAYSIVTAFPAGNGYCVDSTGNTKSLTGTYSSFTSASATSTCAGVTGF